MDANPLRTPPAGGGYWRVAVVEDHLLQRQRTIELIESQRGLRVVHSAETFPSFLEWYRAALTSKRPHLLVLDLIVERGPSVEPRAVREIVRDGVRVLVFSALTSPPLVRQVIRAGVGGVVGKRDPEGDVVAAVWTVLGRGRWMSPELTTIVGGDRGRPVLSDQEERALVLYASGHTLEQVARSLGVKRETAKTYLDRVKAKYAASGRPVRTKVELNRIAIVDGYLEPDHQPALR